MFVLVETRAIDGIGQRSAGSRLPLGTDRPVLEKIKEERAEKDLCSENQRRSANNYEARGRRLGELSEANGRPLEHCRCEG